VVKGGKSIKAFAKDIKLKYRVMNNSDLFLSTDCGIYLLINCDDLLVSSLEDEDVDVIDDEFRFPESIFFTPNAERMTYSLVETSNVSFLSNA